MQKKAPQQSENKAKSLQDYVHYAGFSWSMMLMTLGAAWAGRWLDAYFQLQFPIFLIVTTVSMIVFLLIGTIKKLMRQQEPHREK